MRKITLLLTLFLILVSCGKKETVIEEPVKEEEIVIVDKAPENRTNSWEFTDDYDTNIELLKENPPVYEGQMMIKLDKSWFTDEYKECTEHFETYSGLDDLGRVGVAFANLEYDYMPKSGELRSTDVSEIKPTGWKQKDYPDLIEDVYLYNRCHLIAYSLVDETTDLEEYKYRLFTGTRQMNLAMADEEVEALVYVKQTRNHLLYRVTPIFYKDELLARGVVLERYCVEGLGMSFDSAVYFFNVQDGIEIDYANGESKAN